LNFFFYKTKSLTLIFIKANIEKDIYDERDLKRIRENNIWLHAFHKHVRGREDTVVILMHIVLKWRKKYEVNGELLC
jgi:hypothetical protein